MPGTISIRSPRPTWVLVDDGIPLEVRAIDAYGRKVAEVTDHREGFIIAAAPDLLAVVQDYLDRLERIDPEALRLRGESFAEWDAKRERARLARDRAEGRLP